MNGKTLGLVAYLSIIGWVIAYVIFGNNEQKTSFERTHLKQGFGVGLMGLAPTILWSILPYGLWFIITILNIAVLVLAILGIINALNEKEQKLPVVGDFFDKSFNFIK